MEIMPNGDIVLTVPELQMAVVAVNLSPSRIASSSLSNRLRLAEQAVIDGLVDDPKTEALFTGFHQSIRNRSIDEAFAVALSFRKDTGVDSMRTIIPADEAEMFEDAICALADTSTSKIERYLANKLGPNNPNIRAYAKLHSSKASLLFDILFPPEE